MMERTENAIRITCDKCKRSEDLAVPEFADAAHHFRGEGWIIRQRYNRSWGHVCGYCRRHRPIPRPAKEASE